MYCSHQYLSIDKEMYCSQQYLSIDLTIEDKGESYSRVPRLSDTFTQKKWRYASSKAKLKCATYRR